MCDQWKIEDEEGFATTVPYKTEGLLDSVAWDAALEGVNDVKGAREVESVMEEQALEGVTVLDGAIDPGRGMKELFDFVGWRPYNSFSTNIAN
jgi:hypothetical protein